MVANVHVYCAWLGGIEECLSLLASEELERLATLASAHRRAAYSTGRALLRLALERHTGRPARSHEIRVGPNGKPQCVDGPGISVSHSGEFVACAVTSAGAVGVDVEHPRARRRTAEIASEFFSARENAWLSNRPADRFYMSWVLKESYSKATGAGLFGGLRNLECFVEPPVIESRVRDGEEPPTLCLYGVGSAWLGVAATRGISAAEHVFWGSTPPAEAPDIRWIASC
jgi:phosphopantetheinyl transferase